MNCFPYCFSNFVTNEQKSVMMSCQPWAVVEFSALCIFLSLRPSDMYSCRFPKCSTYFSLSAKVGISFDT